MRSARRPPPSRRAPSRPPFGPFLLLFLAAVATAVALATPAGESTTAYSSTGGASTGATRHHQRHHLVRPGRPAAHEPHAPRHHPPRPSAHPTPSAPAVNPRCPWASQQAQRQHSPDQLADEVIARMSQGQELGMVDLYGVQRLENTDNAVPGLCIPALTLQDGPNGLANGDTGVTQLPASIALAATFDPVFAFRYGQVEGAEARAQGIDVVQGPMLNLVRVPESGRAFETYGEDPFLVSQMGVADIEGIQSEGVMADAKHFVGYTQESDRRGLDQLISTRALEELYLAPFAAAVQQAHVASVMCAYGSINGQPTCANDSLYRTLSAWGFDGFVRSDLRAVKAPLPAFAAGMDAIKPAQAYTLGAGIAHHLLAESSLDRAARRILSEMFTFGLIAHPRPLRVGLRVDSASHTAVALAVAEASTVLLKNARSLLPLEPSHLRSLAVIGGDATGKARTAGYGSAHVIAPFVVRPLAALRAMAPRASISFVDGASSISGTTPIPDDELRPDPGASGFGPGQVSTALIPPGDRKNLFHEVATLTPLTSGLYDLSLYDNSAAWMLLDGRPVIATPAPHGILGWSAAVHLSAHHRYSLELVWQRSAEAIVPVVGWRDVTPDIAAAVRAARHAQVAIVFASDYAAENIDRPNLDLPGDQNALIAAVAAANRRTVVVLNTSGPVLMPWLHSVAAVLEAWYPGEEDGAAIAAVLSGAYDPTGRLPVTFPASENAVPASTLAQWPGVGGTVDFAEGLDIGYRWDQAHGVAPLFPFGYGLSYTSFRLSRLRARPSAGGVAVSVEVANTGFRRGSEVVEAYLAFPPAAGEPPWQLRGVARVTLDPGRSTLAQIFLPASAFRCFLGERFQSVAGRYTLGVGTSSADIPLRLSLGAPGRARRGVV